MFFHHFRYSLGILFRDRMLIFWTFAFPIILGTFFNLAFSNIENSEKLDIIDIAVVENEEFSDNTFWRETLAAMSEGDDAIFSTRYVDADEAARLLDERQIAGYLCLTEDGPRVTVVSDGIDQTVFKYAVDQILQIQTVTEGALELEISHGTIPTEEFVTQLYEDIATIIGEEDTGLTDSSPVHLSYTMIEFYTLIAMVCLYGGILGMVAVNFCLANMSSKGKRIAVSPTPRSKMVLGSMAASYVTQLVGVALLFAYTVFVLRVDYGDKFLLILLLALCGSLAGLTMGTAIAILLKGSEATKTGVVISVTMAGCFFSGMMGITMKYIIDTNLPWLNRLNPANMITDGLYALYYYDTPERYLTNLASLLVFAFLMIALSVFGLRRQRYDSI